MEAKEEIRSRLNIEDVIGEYVQLKRAGRNFKGLSPFAQEKSPSFMVSPEKHIWHDFSSGKGGDVFSFIMEVEGLDFKGALDLLARKAGVDLSQFRTGDNSLGKKKERLFKAMESAANFYQAIFVRSPVAIAYFKKRGLNKQVIGDFKLGFSPQNNELFAALTKRGFTERELRDAGLVTTRRGAPSDMFRGRMMVCLADPQGRPIGFTARLIADEPNAPKYINTPQTLLYDKGRHVFGLHLAKDAIRKADFVVVVEGNMDVIASHQAGVTNVVATAGTALTEHHLRALSRFTQDVRLAFDADKAGVAATERAIALASNLGINLGIVTIPPETGAKDADELIQKGVALWQAAIAQPKDAVEWLLEVYAARYDLTTPGGKRKITDYMLGIIRTVQDPVLLEHYLHTVGVALGVSTQALSTKMSQNGQPAQKTLKPNKADHAVMSQSWQTQDRLLALALAYPEVVDYMKSLSPEAFYAKPIAEHVLLSKPLSPSDDIDVKIKQLQLIAEEYKTLDERDIHNVVAWVKRIKKEYFARLVAEKQQRLLTTQDKTEQQTLNTEIKKLYKDIEALKR